MVLLLQSNKDEQKETLKRKFNKTAAFFNRFLSSTSALPISPNKSNNPVDDLHSNLKVF